MAICLSQLDTVPYVFNIYVNCYVRMSIQADSFGVFKCYSIILAIWSLLGWNIIKTHDSESRGQEETAIIRETKNTRPLSELFTRKSVKKLTNALVKPP